jgi:hypothetical protein
MIILLSGCSSLLTQSAGAGAGVGGAAIANAVTTNGAVTAGIGLGTQAGAGGNIPVGGVGTWAISHDIPIENNEHGELTVTRVITPALPSGAAPAFDCKEIIFSVDTVADKAIQRAFYTATVCEDSGTWKWATAEPATARWGSLQ